MAGINLAKQLIKEKKNKGKVIASGNTVYNEKYVIIHLEGDHGKIYQIDHGGDIKLQDNIGLEDIIELKILDEYTAEWVIVEPGSVPKY